MSGFRGTTSNGDLSAYERGCPFLNTYFPMQKVLNRAKANPVMTFLYPGLVGRAPNPISTALNR